MFIFLISKKLSHFLTSNITHSSRTNQDKFNRLMAVLPDLRVIAIRGEDFLYSKHRAGAAPSKTLLMEMLHAKRRV